MMYRFFALFFLMPLVYPSAGFDVVVLRSGAEMQGNVMAMQGGRLQFQPRWSENITLIPLSELEAVFFSDSGALGDGPLTHRVKFQDGDRLTGTVLQRTESMLRFAPFDGVVVDLPMNRIFSLETLPPQEDRLLKDGMDLSHWQTNVQAAGPMNAVRFQQVHGLNAMPMNNLPVQLNQMMWAESAGPQEFGGTWFFPPSQGISIFRELPDLPDMFRLEYAIRVPGGNYLLNAGLFTQMPLHRGAGGMTVMHQHLQMHAQIFSEVRDPNSNRPRISNWRSPVGPHEGEWQHFQIYVDHPRNRGWMMVNGEKVQEWEMAFEPDTLKNRWISFQMQHNQSGLQLGGLELTRWDGTFPSRDIETFGAGDGEPVLRRRGRDEAEVRFQRHPDRLSLRIREITPTHVVGDGYGLQGTVHLPRERLAGIRFPLVPAGTRRASGLSIDLDTPLLQMDLVPGARP